VPRRTELNRILDYEAVRTGDRDAHGMSRERLMRGNDVEHPFWGVSSAGLDLSTIEGMSLAFRPLMRPNDAISHTSAALLFGAPLPHPEPPLLPLHVTSIGTRAHRGPNLVGHEWNESLQLDVIRGIRVVAPADMWCQLSTMLSREDLVAIGDFLVSGVPAEGRNVRTVPCCSIAELRDAVRRHGRRAGARKLAWAIERVRVGVDSRPETILRLLLVAAGLPEPLVNDPVRVADGKSYKPDLKHKLWRTLYEYEGVLHLRSPKQWRFDTWRYQQFEGVGWKVIRVNADHLFVDPVGFLRFVYETLHRRARELGVAPPSSGPRWLV
jgi:hypothetical protein